MFNNYPPMDYTDSIRAPWNQVDDTDTDTDTDDFINLEYYDDDESDTFMTGIDEAFADYINSLIAK